MANALLDFVMSLVRDPDAAARYAADPSQAIADAHLTNVTSADVNNLIPVVSESLPMGGPGAEAADHNVWTSGAATAAFDAFSDHVAGPPIPDVHQISPTPGDHVLDAFSDHVAGPPIPDVHQISPPGDHVLDAPLDQPVALDHPLDAGLSHPAEPGADLHAFAGLDQPLPAEETHVADDTSLPGAFEHHLVDDHGLPAEHPGFDIF